MKKKRGKKMKKYKIIVETRTYHDYFIDAETKEEAKEKFLADDNLFCSNSYSPDWPDVQKAKIISIEET